MKMLDVPQSGSMAGTTASRNRYGQYWRTRAIPVNPRSNPQGVVRAAFGLVTSGWRALTSDQRAGWGDLGLSMTRRDSLGQSYNLTGAQAYGSLNMILHAAGDALLTDAPASLTPVALASVTVTTTGGTLSVAYTATPLPANAKLFLYASPQRSAGRAFEQDFRLIMVSAAAAASPSNILAAYTAKFGAPLVGKRIFFSLQVMLGGFLSAPFLTSKVVTA